MVSCASLPNAEFSDVTLIACNQRQRVDLHHRNQQTIWMKALLSSLAGCQTSTSSPLPISKPFHLVPPNTHRHCTPLTPSRGKVISLIISSDNYKRQSKHLCRVFCFFLFNFFFLFWLGRFYSHIYTSSVSSLNFRGDFNFIITQSCYLRYAVSERRILGTNADTAVFWVSLGLWCRRHCGKPPQVFSFLNDFYVHATGVLSLKTLQGFP